MRINFLAAIAPLLLGVGSLSAATITILGNANTSADTNGIVNSDGVAIASGTGYVAAGYLTSNNAAGKTLATLVSEFVEFGAPGNFGAGLDIDGLFEFSVTGPTLSTMTPSGAENKRLYVFIGNGSTLLNSTEFVVWDSMITLPSSEPFSTSINVQDTTPATAENLLFGSSTTHTLNFGAGPIAAFTMVAVPEPSVALLGGLGVLGLVARRRRN